MAIVNPQLFSNALINVRKFIEDEAFKGYDPYDTLNSPIPFGLPGKWGPVLAIQFQKRNPVNLRPLLGIKKEINPKAMGLLLHAYSNLYRIDPDPGLRSQCDSLFEWLLENTSKGFDHHCWGYNFDWASPVKYLKAYSPTIVVSAFIAKGIFAYHHATGNARSVDVLKSIGDFVLHDLPLSEDETGICFSYSTKAKDCCYNASMLGAELFAGLYHLTHEEKYRDLSRKAVDFVLARQHDDGHWNYSIDLYSGKERRQIDFHQGYVLDSLDAFIRFTGPDDEKYTSQFKKGAEYYKQTQFLKTGQSKWRIPDKWPVDIHNQSQGIITFSRLGDIAFAATIAEWTIKHLQDKKGYFYFRKYPAFTNRIPYMRWGQCWMMLALTELQMAEKTTGN